MGRGALVRYPYCNCAMWELWVRYPGDDVWTLHREYVEYEAAKYDEGRVMGRAETEIRQIR